MKPYYEHAGVTIYHADAALVLPSLSPCDLLLTDPPYGIGADSGQASRANKRHGKAVAESRDYGPSDWDTAPPPRWLLEQAISIAAYQIVFGGNYFDLPPARCWLVWDKENGRNDYADCELAWTNLDKAVRKLTYRWHGMLQEPGCPKEIREYPTQKPEAVMRWALSLVPDARTVLDPFMGSGTTLVACKRLGRACVGIDKREQACEIAATRLSQGALRLEIEAAV